MVRMRSRVQSSIWAPQRKHIMNKKRLYKNSKEGKIFGVCAGIAEYFDIDVTLVRLITIVLVFGAGSGLVAYIIAAIVMPEKPVE